MPAKPSTNDMGASAHTMCEHVLADMHRVAAAIKQAQSACGLGAEVCEFGSAPTHTHHRQVPATVSSTTRRRAAARAANGLQQAAACVEGAVQGLQQLQLATASHKKKVTTLSGRLHRAESVLADRTQQLQHAQRAMPPTSAAHHFDAQAAQLQQQCDALAARATDAQRTHTQQVDRLQTQLTNAHTACKRAEEQLAQSRAEHQRCEAVVARQHAVISALTADNVVAMVKLQAAQDEAAQQRREADTLRGALQSQEGPWFAQVQQGVQHHVQGALRRALEAEQALDAARDAHAAQVEELQRRLQAATDEAQHATERVRCLEIEAALLREAAARARAEGLHEAEVACGAREAARHEEWAALQHTVGVVQTALEAAQARVAALQEERAGLEERAAAAESAAAQAAAALQARVAEERAINQRLMQRKEEIEWQLLQALAAQRDGGERLLQ